MKLKVKIKSKLSARFQMAMEVQIDLSESPITAIFGPSGSGKTSFLRCLAGLDFPENGKIEFQNETWFDSRQGISIPPQLRKVGYLAQGGSLFPHLSVKQNIGYGIRRLPILEVKQRVASLLSSLKLEGLEESYPSQLSGGETQRASLARALAPQPRLLLLDEPLSALDAPSRDSLRLELRGLLKTLGLPALLVTHDRTEVHTLAQEIIVMNQGRIEQKGRVEEVFKYPQSVVSAKALGVENLIPIQGGMTSIRAEDMTLIRHSEPIPDGYSPFLGIIQDIVHEGALVRINVNHEGFPICILITQFSFEAHSFKNFEKIYALVKPDKMHLIRNTL
jgi:molybdate transport system ATP-binding protein